jgi:hypothetical protein|tara:strand:- start:1842 stop:2051 length:210 start_codon:yes stop_codon:yes gene_type:complete
MEKERTFTFEDKTYKESDLNDGIVNIFLVQTEMVQSRLRHEIELEKIKVLNEYYDKKLKELLKDKKSIK